MRLASTSIAVRSLRRLVACAVAALVPAVALAAEPTLRAAAPRVAAPELESLDAVPAFTLPALDTDFLRFEDELAAERLGAPLRFAVPHEVFVTPDNAGSWSTLADGRMVWRLRVQADDTRNLNFGFTRYAMPPGGRLTIYSPDGATWAGPFDAGDNQAHGELWTPVLQGGEAVIEVVVPAAERGALDLELGAVNQGYRDVFHGGGDGEFTKSGACNVDVACPQGDGWRDQIRSVVAYSYQGFFVCTGAMINNTAQDLTPYLLTAEHCEITTANDQTLVLYWQYQNSTCRTPGSGSSGGPGNGSLAMAQTGGGVLRADYRNLNSGVGTDFALVEMNTAPQASFDPFWAGWDRRDRTFSSAVGIHHPQVEEKRISFENDPVSIVGFGSEDDTHIEVSDWDVGTTEQGSSGSPLFSPEGRIIGQLHGGFAACGNDEWDVYGRLARSWNGGGTKATRLRDWLDPLGTGAMTLDGTDELPVIGEPPAAPTQLVATVVGTTVQLGWQDNSDDEDGFEVQMRSSGGSFTSLGTVGANVVAAEVGGLTPGTYTFKVRAFNDEGPSPFSNQQTVTVGASGPTECIESDTVLCLNGGRFRVSIRFDSGQQSGDAKGMHITDDTGWFYFFNQSNVEVVVKALDGCDVPGSDHYWVFAAGLTNVEVDLTVTDTSIGLTKEYHNVRGQRFAPIQDTSAFATCP